MIAMAISTTSDSILSNTPMALATSCMLVCRFFLSRPAPTTSAVISSKLTSPLPSRSRAAKISLHCSSRSRPSTSIRSCLYSSVLPSPTNDSHNLRASALEAFSVSRASMTMEWADVLAKACLPLISATIAPNAAVALSRACITR